MPSLPISRDDLNFWLDTADERPCEPLRGAADADIAIIGAGFAGLSAAYHLIKARPDLDIVLIDSHRVGSGASGRNTGMLGPRVGGSILDLCRRYGRVEAQRLYRASLDAVTQLKALIVAEGIACDLEHTQQVRAALTTHQAKAVNAEACMLEQLGFAAPFYDDEAMADMSPVHYRAGVGFPESGLLNPLRLCREMKRIVLARGVRVHEQTPITSLLAGMPVTLMYPGGRLTARRVILTTNAYTAQLGILQGRIIPIQTHVIQTSRLTRAQLDRLNWPARTPFFEASRIFNYFRLTPDNRIMFGGGRPLYEAGSDRRSGTTDVADPAVWRAQLEVFRQRFPSLADVSIAHQWSGSVAMTLDHLPIVGELDRSPGIFFAGGWNGHGVAMATACGATIAEYVNGAPRSHESFPWRRGTAPGIPGDPLRRFGLSVYLSGLRLIDRVELATDRFSQRISKPRLKQTTSRPDDTQLLCHIIHNDRS